MIPQVAVAAGAWALTMTVGGFFWQIGANLAKKKDKTPEKETKEPKKAP